MVSFVQFKKREKHPWRSVTLLKASYVLDTVRHLRWRFFAKTAAIILAYDWQGPKNAFLFYLEKPQLTFTCSNLTIETLRKRCEILSKLTIKTSERRQ